VLLHTNFVNGLVLFVDRPRPQQGEWSPLARKKEGRLWAAPTHQFSSAAFSITCATSFAWTTSEAWLPSTDVVFALMRDAKKC